jgi:uncharacterized protein YybS (DUF2232 family)
MEGQKQEGKSRKAKVRTKSEKAKRELEGKLPPFFLFFFFCFLVCFGFSVFEKKKMMTLHCHFFHGVAAKKTTTA